MEAKPRGQFAEANREKQVGIATEFRLFLTENRKYWLIPLIICLLLLGVILILGGTSAAPFIYTLF